MKLKKADLEWLVRNFPDLLYDAENNILVGELEFCANYDPTSGKVRIGNEADRGSHQFICDSFSIKVELDRIDSNGWPQVREVGRRRLDIAERECINLMDLHFYSNATDTCCLGIRAAPERNLTIARFMTEILVPFFYRLSYTDQHGLEVARRDLWDEYSHGDGGYQEYDSEILWILDQAPGRNDPCPCRSGEKYKRCHLDEVKAVKSKRWQGH